MSYWFRDEAPAAVAVAPARTPVSQAQTQTRNIITQQYSNRSTNRSRGSTSTRSYVSSVNDLGGASRSATVRRRGGSSNIAKRATLDALAANQEKDLKQTAILTLVSEWHAKQQLGERKIQMKRQKEEMEKELALGNEEVKVMRRARLKMLLESEYETHMKELHAMGLTIVRDE